MGNTIRKPSATQYTIDSVRISVVYLHDHVADVELLLTATAQYHNSILPCISSLGKKNQNSKFEMQSVLNVYHFCTTVKLKSPKSNKFKVVYFHDFLRDYRMLFFLETTPDNLWWLNG